MSQSGNRPDFHPRRLRNLVDRLAAGTLTDDEHAELDEIIANDPAARKYYLEQTFLVGKLFWRCAGHQNSPQVASPLAVDAEPTVPSVLGFLADVWHATYESPRILMTIVGGALAGYFLIVFALIPLTRWAGSPRPAENVPGGQDRFSAAANLNHSSSSIPGETVGSHKADLQASWSLRAAKPTDNAARVGQRYELTSGRVELALARGARLIIAGPAVWQIDSEQRLSLHRGRVAAFVPAAAKGFTVVTPTAEIVDLGTEFVVDVDDADETRLAVLRGTVQLATIAPAPVPSHSSGRPALMVSAGQAITVSATSAGHVVAETTSFDSPWVRRMTRLGQLSVLDEVIAYQAFPTGLAGNYPGTAPLGNDFQAIAPIRISSLGVFDSRGDGIDVSSTLTVRLWAVDDHGTPDDLTDDTGTQLLAEQAFTADSSGILEGCYRFKSLPEPIDLQPGLYSVVVDGISRENPCFDFYDYPITAETLPMDPRGRLEVNTSHYAIMPKYSRHGTPGMPVVLPCKPSGKNYITASFIFAPLEDNR